MMVVSADGRPDEESEAQTMSNDDDERDDEANWRSFKAQAAFVIVIVVVTLFVLGPVITAVQEILGRL
jgi:hypothetical protein